MRMTAFPVETQIMKIMGSIGTAGACAPSALLYNRHWMLRLVLAAAEQGVSCLPMRFHPPSRWFSDALLHSPCRADSPNGLTDHKLLHTDAVVGSFWVDAAGSVTLTPEGKQFLIFKTELDEEEGKGGAPFPGDRTALTLAAMAETLRRAGTPLARYTSLGLITILPACRVNTESADSPSRHEVRERIAALAGEEFGEDGERAEPWLRGWALPLIEIIELHCISWEGVIELTSQQYPRYGRTLAEFYEGCRSSRRRA
jgi:hypothetical protein